MQALAMAMAMGVAVRAEEARSAYADGAFTFL
jgi:hypothetical protein